ncbi:MAG: bifunctional rhamnulose-1-phosphate aldolase/short-chain dehydrogenase [Dehalococcoidia bacterium]
MQNRWLDADARDLAPLDLLVYVSRLMGQDSSLVLWGGGNTSLKQTETDFRGRETRVLRVKGSGSDMKSVQPKDFPGVRMDDVLPLIERAEMADEEMVAYLARTLMEPESPRPSIETLLHTWIPRAFVLHSHADAILSLTNVVSGDVHVRRCLGTEVAIVPYRRPGFALAKQVALAYQAEPSVRGVVLMNHGLITWADDAKDAYDTHVEMVARAEEYTRANDRRVFGPLRCPPLGENARREVAAKVAPVIRGAVSARQRSVLRFDDAPEVLEFTGAEQSHLLSQVGAATPDHILNTKRLPLWIEVDDPSDVDALAAAARAGVARYAEEYAAYVQRHNVDGYPMLDPYPRVILVPGVGMWSTGKDAARAAIPAEIYQHTIRVIGGAQAADRYASLAEKDAFEADYWPLELYKLTLLPPEKDLARRVALVTGAARGIGRAIAERFAREGAHVVVTDVDAGGAQSTAAEIVDCEGAGRALGVELDVTSVASVAGAFRAAALTYGGVDVVVSNAGIAESAPLEQLSAEQWRRSLEVNATGHFLVSQAAIRLMREQGIGGSIIFVASKNVVAPGRDFAAYSSAKAAEAQLARIVAIEAGEHGIRANILNPDAVFEGSGLFSPELRENRARAHGVAPEDLESFYQQRNLLKVRVTGEDVAEAALFFASDRSLKTTGAMLSVDGGVREAFVR